MSRYLVKNKYTYEKIRQTDYTYAPDNWALSQTTWRGVLSMRMPSLSVH